MRIIVEGADGVGKSTVVEYLAKKYNCDIIHMTAWGSRDYCDYHAKLSLNNVISDRSFLSEMVYKQAFGLQPKLTFTQLDALMNHVKENDWKFIILTAPVDVLKQRLHERGNESEDIINAIELIDHLYRIYGTTYDIPIIDTSNKFYMDDIEEVI